jgi:hypothetical protein
MRFRRADMPRLFSAAQDWAPPQPRGIDTGLAPRGYEKSLGLPEIAKVCNILPA